MVQGQPDRVTQYTYDGRNFVKTTKISGSTRTATYNGFGEVIQYIDEVGRRTETSYDGLGRERSIRVGAQANDAITYERTYDGNGNLLTEASPQRTTTYRYNALNQLFHSMIAGGSLSATIEYEYDSRIGLFWFATLNRTPPVPPTMC